MEFHVSEFGNREPLEKVTNMYSYEKPHLQILELRLPVVSHIPRSLIFLEAGDATQLADVLIIFKETSAAYCVQPQR